MLVVGCWKNENEMGNDNDVIGGPKSDQTAVGDAIRKTAQETKKLYTRKLHGILRTCPEIPRSVGIPRGFDEKPV